MSSVQKLRVLLAEGGNSNRLSQKYRSGLPRERDALTQAADYLATLEGVRTAILFGIVDGAIHLSGRSTDSHVDLGDALGDAFGDVGSAGGHQNMAGGEIPLGIFADYTSDDDQPLNIVEQVITAQLVAELNLADEATD